MLALLSCCPRLTGLEIPANSRITRKSLDSMVDAERPVGSAMTSLSLVRGPVFGLLRTTCIKRLHRIMMVVDSSEGFCVGHFAFVECVLLR